MQRSDSRVQCKLKTAQTDPESDDPESVDLTKSQKKKIKKRRCQEKKKTKEVCEEKEEQGFSLTIGCTKDQAGGSQCCKAPADIRKPNNDSLARVVEEEKLINWINDEAVEHCTPFQFNSHALVQRIRQARADLVEFHVNKLRWDKILPQVSPRTANKSLSTEKL